VHGGRRRMLRVGRGLLLGCMVRACVCVCVTIECMRTTGVAAAVCACCQRQASSARCARTALRLGTPPSSCRVTTCFTRTASRPGSRSTTRVQCAASSCQLATRTTTLGSGRLATCPRSGTVESCVLGVGLSVSSPLLPPPPPTTHTHTLPWSLPCKYSFMPCSRVVQEAPTLAAARLAGSVLPGQ
jgi:hypothetical protein